MGRLTTLHSTRRLHTTYIIPLLPQNYILGFLSVALLLYVHTVHLPIRGFSLRVSDSALYSHETVWISFVDDFVDGFRLFV